MSIGPTARRYWFADRTGLDALAAAIDPPDWADVELPLVVFTDDETVRADIAAADADMPVRATDEFEAALAGETAEFVQFAFRPVEDFGPGLDLVMAKLEAGETDCLNTDILAVSMCETMLSEAGAPEACWMSVDLLRAQETGDPVTVLAAARQTAASPVHLPVVASAVFIGTPGDETAQWRARTAAANAEIDRLNTERRVRRGREAALAARHERDLARQAQRSSAEIENLHQALGWAGRWKARLARIAGRK